MAESNDYRGDKQRPPPRRGRFAPVRWSDMSPLRGGGGRSRERTHSSPWISPPEDDGTSPERETLSDEVARPSSATVVLQSQTREISRLHEQLAESQVQLAKLRLELAETKLRQAAGARKEDMMAEKIQRLEEQAEKDKGFYAMVKSVSDQLNSEVNASAPQTLNSNEKFNHQPSIAARIRVNINDPQASEAVIKDDVKDDTLEPKNATNVMSPRRPDHQHAPEAYRRASPDVGMPKRGGQANTSPPGARELNSRHTSPDSSWEGRFRVLFGTSNFGEPPPKSVTAPHCDYSPNPVDQKEPPADGDALDYESPTGWGAWSWERSDLSGRVEDSSILW